MIATWMLYSLLTAALLGVAALGVEAACRQLQWPLRWVWVGAMALGTALVALAPLRGTERIAEQPTFELPVAYEEEGPAVAMPEPSRLAALELRLRQVAARAFAPLVAADRYLLAGWAGSVALALGALVVTYSRFARRRRRWPTSELQGTRVRVTPDLGPAVVGVRRAEIVVPRWFLALPPADTRLVLDHEREHLRARDPLLLTLAWSVVALLAWNPALWWMLSRLRLAMELDCDARVLERGTDRHAYGAVLIELAGRSARLRPGMMALADPPSQLERRLLAMTSRPTRFAGARAALLATLAGTAVLAACRAELPTAAQIQTLDVKQAEQAADAFAIVSEAGTVYTLDGVVVTPEVARAVSPERIASIGVKRVQSPTEPAQIEIVTRAAAAVVVGTLQGETGIAHPSEAAAAAGPIRIRGSSQIGGPTPVLLVDGVRRPYDARTSPFGDMPPNEVESVSVIKDPVRGVELVGPDGANGVIIVRTKNGADDGIELPEAGNFAAATSVSLARSAGGMTREQLDAALAKAHPETAVWIIDGQRVQHSDALALNPAEVLRVIVTAEPSDAMRAGLGADAEHGMVQIATTRGRTRQPER